MEFLNGLSLDQNHIFYEQDLNDSFHNFYSDNSIKNNFDFLPFSFEQEENIFLNENKNIYDIPDLMSKKNENNKSKIIDLEEEEPKNFQNETIPEISTSEITKNITFKTKLHQKRGRKEKYPKEGKKYHGSGDFDNIQRKLQVNFFNFLISLANDAIKTYLKDSKFCFKDIIYKYKKVVTHRYVEKLKKWNYSDIMQLKVSPKNRSYGENNNREVYLEICKISPELKKLFDKNYLYMFQKYFCKIKNKEQIIDVDGLKIKLSQNTKGLYYLLGKNSDGKGKFMDVVKNVYFSGKNYINEVEPINSNPFIISQ